jgi:hypothetical protein
MLVQTAFPNTSSSPLKERLIANEFKKSVAKDEWMNLKQG